MIALPADHFIDDPADFRNTLRKGIRSLPGATAVVFGVRPIRPDTGYGYVQAEKPAVPADAWPVIRFVEKPDAKTAAAYLQAGNFFWNSGIFLWANRMLLDLFQRFMPDIYEGLSRLRPLIRIPKFGAERRRIFSDLRRISIDFGILERASGLRLVPAEFGWDDIGNWAALARALPGDAEQNVARGLHFTLDSSGCITYSDAGPVAVFGVKDLVVVQAQGKVLVCSRDHASDLKRMITALSAHKRRGS